MSERMTFVEFMTEIAEVVRRECPAAVAEFEALHHHHRAVAARVSDAVMSERRERSEANG